MEFAGSRFARRVSSISPRRGRALAAARGRRTRADECVAPSGCLLAGKAGQGSDEGELFASRPRSLRDVAVPVSALDIRVEVAATHGHRDDVVETRCPRMRVAESTVDLLAADATPPAVTLEHTKQLDWLVLHTEPTCARPVSAALVPPRLARDIGAPYLTTVRAPAGPTLTGWERDAAVNAGQVPRLVLTTMFGAGGATRLGNPLLTPALRPLQHGERGLTLGLSSALFLGMQAVIAPGAPLPSDERRTAGRAVVAAHALVGFAYLGWVLYRDRADAAVAGPAWLGLWRLGGCTPAVQAHPLSCREAAGAAPQQLAAASSTRGVTFTGHGGVLTLGTDKSPNLRRRADVRNDVRVLRASLLVADEVGGPKVLGIFSEVGAMRDRDGVVDAEALRVR